MRLQTNSSLGLAALVLAALASPAGADVGSRFGYGSRSSALAGAGAAWGSDGYAAFMNPAALSVPELVSESTSSSKRLVISWGIVDLSPNFTPINGVVTENTTTSDK